MKLQLGTNAFNGSPNGKQSKAQLRTRDHVTAPAAARPSAERFRCRCGPTPPLILPSPPLPQDRNAPTATLHVPPPPAPLPAGRQSSPANPAATHGSSRDVRAAQQRRHTDTQSFLEPSPAPPTAPAPYEALPAFTSRRPGAAPHPISVRRAGGGHTVTERSATPRLPPAVRRRSPLVAALHPRPASRADDVTAAPVRCLRE